jgi:hypothetical protein
MTMLDAKFVAGAREKPFEFEHGTNILWFQNTEASAGEDPTKVVAELEVTLDDQVVGYITQHSDEEHGVIRAADFGTAVPERFRTLEGALEFLLPGVADGLAEKPALVS